MTYTACLVKYSRCFVSVLYIVPRRDALMLPKPKWAHDLQVHQGFGDCTWHLGSFSGLLTVWGGSLVERRYPEGIFQRIVKSPSFFCAPGIPRMTVMKRMVLRQRNPGKAASALMCKQQVDRRISLRHDRHDCMNPGTCMKT